MIYLPVSFPILFIPFMLFSFISEPLLGVASPPAYILIPSAFFMMF